MTNTALPLGLFLIVHQLFALPPSLSLSPSAIPSSSLDSAYMHTCIQKYKDISIQEVLSNSDPLGTEVLGIWSFIEVSSFQSVYIHIYRETSPIEKMRIS